MDTSYTPRIVGSLIIGLSTTYIVANGLMLAILLRKGEASRSSGHELMTLLSVSNVLQLTSHLASGICLLCEEFVDVPVLPKTLGANLDGSFLVYAVFTAILAFERFLHVASPSLMRRLFSLTAMKAWFLLALLMWLAVSALLSTPLITLSFNREQFFWRYSYSSSDIGFYQSVTEAAVLVPFMTAALLHVAIAVIIAYQKHVKRLLVTQSYVERRILIQAAVIAAYDVGTTALWALDVLPASTLSTVLLDLMWVVSGGVNPIVYFSLNRDKEVEHEDEPGRVPSSEATRLVTSNKQTFCVWAYDKLLDTLFKDG